MNRIKEIRKEKKLSRKKLAEMAGLSPSYIQFIENEQRNPTVKTIKKIAAALGASLDELFSKDSKSEVREWLKQLGRRAV
jgi:transcriptional regulator with XRE-family HTH domain